MSTTAAATLPSMMRACQIASQGELDVINVSQIQVPSPKENEVLIKVEYAGVNFIDTYQRAGVYKLPMPFTLGNECSGRVVAVGSASSSFKVGDAVAAYTAGGSFAEFAVSSEAKTVHLTAATTTREAATVLLQGLTALTFTREAHAVKEGECIAIQAAAGGLGLLLTQLCKYLGARVIGTTSTAEKAALAKAAGASEVVLYDGSVDVVAEIKRLAGGGAGLDNGVHAVFDGVGAATWDSAFEIVRRKGTIVTCGNASGTTPPFAALRLGPKNLKICRPVLSQYVYTKEEFTTYANELFKLVSDGHLKLSTWGNDYELTTESIRQTQMDIMSRKTSGKLLVRI